jgi:hypothetical protein
MQELTPADVAAINAELATERWRELHGEPCDVCGEPTTDFNRHNREAYVRHLEIAGELHVLDCRACGRRTDPSTDEFVPGWGWYHSQCQKPTTTR